MSVYVDLSHRYASFSICIIALTCLHMRGLACCCVWMSQGGSHVTTRGGFSCCPSVFEWCVYMCVCVCVCVCVGGGTGMSKRGTGMSNAPLSLVPASSPPEASPPPQ